MSADDKDYWFIADAMKSVFKSANGKMLTEEDYLKFVKVVHSYQSQDSSDRYLNDIKASVIEGRAEHYLSKWNADLLRLGLIESTEETSS